jgi:hypothetical protein
MVETISDFEGMNCAWLQSPECLLDLHLVGILELVDGVQPVLHQATATNLANAIRQMHQPSREKSFRLRALCDLTARTCPIRGPTTSGFLSEAGQQPWYLGKNDSRNVFWRGN